MDKGRDKPVFSSFRTGEILMGEGLVSRGDIDDALGIMGGKRSCQHGVYPLMIGNALCRLNRIDPLDLYRVLYDNDKLLSVGEIMSRNGYPGKCCGGGSDSRAAGQPGKGGSVYGRVLSLCCNFDYAEKLDYDPKIAGGLSEMADFASMPEIMPLSLSEDKLEVAFHTQGGMLTLLRLKERFRYLRVSGVVVSGSYFNRLLRQGFPSGHVQTAPFCCAAEKEGGLRIRLSDPLSQRTAVRRLYYRYINVKGGGMPRPGEQARFHEFIGLNFNMICERYGCSWVEFLVDEDTASIKASPGDAAGGFGADSLS